MNTEINENASHSHFSLSMREREREEKTKAPKIVSIEFYNVHEPRHGGRGASNPDLAFA